MDPSLQAENRVSGSSQATAAVSKQQKSRSTNSRDERFRSGKGQRCSWGITCPKRKSVPVKWYLHLHRKLQVLWKKGTDNECLSSIFLFRCMSGFVWIQPGGNAGRERDCRPAFWCVSCCEFYHAQQFFHVCRENKLGFRSVEELLKHFEDYSVWIWGMFCLLVWVILLKEGYIFIVAFFQIFPGLKQTHKKGKCHNGYSTSF